MAKTEVEFTFDEAVRTIGVTPARLDKLIADGKIVAHQETGRTRIPRESILQYLSQVSPLLTKDRKKLEQK